MFETLFTRDILNALIKKLLKIRSSQKSEMQELSDIFGDPISLAKYYVEPLCQHHNPADFNEEEAISSVQSPASITLKSFFDREITIRDGRSQLFVLSDAGMGKTSLLVMVKLHFTTSFWPKKNELHTTKTW